MPGAAEFFLVRFPDKSSMERAEDILTKASIKHEKIDLPRTIKVWADLESRLQMSVFLKKAGLT